MIECMSSHMGSLYPVGCTITLKAYLEGHSPQKLGRTDTKSFYGKRKLVNKCEMRGQTD